MILGARRKLRGLSPWEYLAIVVTVLIPTVVSSVFDLSTGWVWIISAGWCPVAVLLIAVAHTKQQERADRSVDEKVEEVSGQLQALGEQHDETVGRLAGLEQQVDQVNQVMRTAFGRIGVDDLPPQRHEVSAGSVSWEFQLPAVAGKVRSGRWWVRLWRWVRSKVQWVKRWIERIVWDWDKAA